MRCPCAYSAHRDEGAGQSLEPELHIDGCEWPEEVGIESGSSSRAVLSSFTCLFKWCTKPGTWAVVDPNTGQLNHPTLQIWTSRMSKCSKRPIGSRSTALVVPSPLSGTTRLWCRGAKRQAENHPAQSELGFSEAHDLAHGEPWEMPVGDTCRIQEKHEVMCVTGRVQALLGQQQGGGGRRRHTFSMQIEMTCHNFYCCF